MQVYNPAGDNTLDRESPVAVNVDGRAFEVPAGTILALYPGESITLRARQYHQFWAEGGASLVGEVSKVNDDERDNFFLPALKVGRFPAIENDVAPLHFLCWEYPPAAS